MSWRTDLRPATWRGVHFHVWTTDSRMGRRTAVHEYPFRDPVWVEDLGKAARKLNLIGFLEGDNVVAQLAELERAVEQEGPGELVHPVLGSCQCSLLDFGVATRVDAGRMVELAFVFLEGGERAFPGVGIDFAAGIFGAAGAADAAASADFGTRALGALRQGAQAAQQAQSTLRLWVSQAQRVAGDVGSVVNSVGGLVPGLDRSFGRYLTGSRSPLAAVNRQLGSVSQGLASVARARSAVTQAGATVSRLASLL